VSRREDPVSDGKLTLERVLDVLTEKQRDAYVLREGVGMTAGEVAEILGISESGVHERVRSARARLEHRFPELRVTTKKDEP
jgi:RNA polymerase sigma factor (sigma-70 family)